MPSAQAAHNKRSEKFPLFLSFDFRLPLSRLGITHVRHGSALAAPSALRDNKKNYRTIKESEGRKISVISVNICVRLGLVWMIMDELG